MAELLGTSLFNDANLVAYYRLESGALTTDSKGSNTLTNNNTVGEGVGKYGGAADFGTANTNKYLSRTDGLGVDLSGAASVSFWVKQRTAPGEAEYDRYIDWRSTTGTARYLIVDYTLASGVLKITIDASGTIFTNNVDLGTSNYHHIVVTYAAGGTVTLYIDNVAIDTDTRGTGTSTNALAIGSDTGGTTTPASCFIDDVAFLNKELSTGEINTLYQDAVANKSYGFFI